MVTRQAQYDVIIIGGGITGLAAAWELEQNYPNIRYAILEQDDRWGGKVLTQQFSVDGAGTFTGDAGPESFVTRKPAVWDLVHELGFERALIEPANETRNTYLLHNGEILRVPLSPLSFFGSSLLTPRGKARMLAEPLIRARRDLADESLAAFIERRLGREACDNLIGPILSGIYHSDPRYQSILTTSPVMRAMEQEHGSIFLGALARRLSHRTNGNARKPKPRFITIAGGAERLIQQLTIKLNGVRKLNTHVSQIMPQGLQFGVFMRDGQCLLAHSIILATPANIAGQLLGTAFSTIAQALDSIPHRHIGTMLLAYRDEAIQLDQPVFGLMIPRREGRLIDAVTWTSAKIAGSAPAGHQLIRVFFGGASPMMVELEETELLKHVRSELRGMLKIEADPVGYARAQWPLGYPQAHVGHLDLVDQIEKLCIVL